jgi:uncharacterized membrane protein YcaP (DUF421 family)
MWNLQVPWWELVARAAVVYVFLLTILRLTGKRQVGQLAPFDLVLLLVLSNAVQNAMTGPDNSVAGGIIICTTLVAINTAMAYATYRSKTIESLIEGRPQVLIHNGKLDERMMRKEKITHHELMASLRAAGCAAPTEVHFAILENNGHISVQPRKMNGENHSQDGPHTDKPSHDPGTPPQNS